MRVSSTASPCSTRASSTSSCLRRARGSCARGPVGIIGLVIATPVVGGGLAWGGGALRKGGRHGAGVAMIFAAVFVVLGGGLRAAVIAVKHAHGSAGTGETDGPPAPSSDDENRTREVCAANSGLSDAWSVRSFCGCVAVGWRDGR